MDTFAWSLPPLPDKIPEGEDIVGKRVRTIDTGHWGFVFCLENKNEAIVHFDYFGVLCLVPVDNLSVAFPFPGTPTRWDEFTEEAMNRETQITDQEQPQMKVTWVKSPFTRGRVN